MLRYSNFHNFPQPLQDHLAVLNKQVKALQKKQRLQHRRDANCGLTDRSMKLVLSTYMLPNYDLDLAERVGRVLLERQAKYDHQRVHHGPVPVRDWFINEPIELFDAVLLPVTA